MKKAIAINLQHYLSISMTFIYRQIISLNREFDLIVLNSKILENTDLFPFDSVYTKKKSDLIKVQKFNDYFFRKFPKDAVNPHLSFSQLSYFRDKLKYNSIQLIHSHFGPSGLEILPLARELNLPLIVTFHGFDGSSLLNNKIYFNNISKLLDYAYIIFVSQNMADRFINLGLQPKKYQIIRCGIPIDYFQFVKRTSVHEKYLGREKIKFLQVSNFVEKKGHVYTVRAFKELLRFYENVELIFAGDGPTRFDIEKLCLELCIQDKVIFKGKVNQNDALKLMQSSDVFLHHSVTSRTGETEGIPTVIMEAMSTGLPVISTYHSGISELVEDGITGFLINEKDVLAYYNKMVLLLKFDKNFVTNSREKIIKEFNLYVEMQKLTELYKNVIEN